jgi:collagenase-like PrtC family protease
MKILSPLDSPSEVEPLIEAGAGEFYCGVLEESWYEPYPVISINRRPAGKGHMRNFAELAEAVALAHRHAVPVFFTINEHYYTKQQLPLVKDYIAQARDAGVDAFIIADYGLLHLLRELSGSTGIHISTGGTVFNWRAARFYGELGADRITLPRHLTLAEMKKLVRRVPEMETSVFVFNSRCINIDGFCTFQHGLSGRQTTAFYRNACMLPYDITPIPLMATAAEEPLADTSQLIAGQRVWETVHLDDYPCAACALYELKQMGITSLKIVGRGNTTVRKLEDVTFFKTLLYHLYHLRPGISAFREYARGLYNKTYNRPCRSFMCHYPSVME